MNFKFDGDRLFFTSDTHFNHTNILQYCNRPFKTVDQIQVDFLLPDLNAHRHCNVLEPVYESLSDILEVMITENEIDSAV